MIIKIDEQGNLKGFYDEITDLIPKEDRILKEKKRVSHIVPKNRILRLIFKTIRKIVKDESKIANWTRTWRCKWTVIIDGKEYKTFQNRKEAINYEKKKIIELQKF